MILCLALEKSNECSAAHRNQHDVQDDQRGRGHAQASLAFAQECAAYPRGQHDTHPAHAAHVTHWAALHRHEHQRVCTQDRHASQISIALIAYLASWIVLHLISRGKNVNFAHATTVALLLLVLGLLRTFPPFLNLLADT